MSLVDLPTPIVVQVDAVLVKWTLKCPVLVPNSLRTDSAQIVGKRTGHGLWLIKGNQQGIPKRPPCLVLTEHPLTKQLGQTWFQLHLYNKEERKVAICPAWA